jgi:MFS transporter, OFA family, oxalate/formate antiporter
MINHRRKTYFRIKKVPTSLKTPVSVTPGAKYRMYYGWYIAGVAFIAYFLATGTGFYAFNAFLEPLCQLHGWSRTDLNLALVIGTLFSFICQYIYGALLKKTGVRLLMLLGSIVSGLSFIYIPRVQTLWQFYLVYSLLFIGNGAYGGIVASTAVNNWFLQKRGKALGFATAGMSLSGAILPIGVLILIHWAGILSAALCIGLVIISFGPLAWIVVKDWPEDIGLGPDGRLLESAPPVISGLTTDAADLVVALNPEADIKSLAHNETFWKIGIAFALLMIGTVGVMSQLKPRFTDNGFTHMTAMAMMGMTALAGAIGKYMWGSLCDRFEPRLVSSVLAAANVIGLGFAFLKQSVLALVLFIILYGFSMGGTMSVYPVIIASVFGRKNFVYVLRYVSIFLCFQLLGYLIAGLSFDFTGSYDAAYGVFITLDIVAAALLFTLRTRR